MSKDKKSMDDVLASIRRIIRTDPSAAPPDAASLPTGGMVDETARAVLDKLREGSDEDDGLGKPLSTSDDPDETARAVLEQLRKQAELDAKPKPAAAKPAETAEAPAVDTALAEPPEAAVGANEVPAFEDDDIGAADHLARVDSLILNDSPSASEDLEDDLSADDEEDEVAVPAVEEAALEEPEEEKREVLAPRPKAKAAAPAKLPEAAKKPAPAARKDAPVMIDEEALEALVRRVVRDELMGEMGRRMSKNVQKLIQAEIARGRIEKK